MNVLPMRMLHTDHHHLLRSCETLRHLLQIHGRLATVGSSSDEPFSTLLLDSYSSLGDAASAETVFLSTRSPSRVSYNSMIRAYLGARQCHTALRLFLLMLRHAIQPDNYTFTFVIKACAEIPSVDVGAAVNAQVVRRGLARNVYVGTTLVDMYCKWGAVETAREVFDGMPERDVITWNTMIDGSAQCGNVLDALGLLRRMQAAGVEPSKVTLLNLLPAVCVLQDGALCRELHGYAVRRGIGLRLCNGLVNAYSKCGLVGAARRVFDGMEGTRDAVSWGAMISGYVHNGCFCEALDLFDELRLIGIEANSVSVVSGIVAATEIVDLERGVGILNYASLHGIDREVQVATSLVMLYARCGCLEKASELFNGIREKDAVSWCAMISAFSQQGHPSKAFSVFREMQEAGIRPNRASLVSILPACIESFDVKAGKSVHSYLLKSMDKIDEEVGTSLIAMYAKLGESRVGSLVFDRLPQKDIVIWNALISGYAHSGNAMDAIKIFKRLWSLGLQVDRGTIVSVLPPCALLNALHQGMSFHAITVKSGFDNDILVKNALIDLYAKCGDLKAALLLFNEYGCCEDIVSWNTIIAGFMHNGCAREALSYFYRLRNKGFKANLATVVSVLPGAAQLGNVMEGMKLHCYVIRAGFESYLTVGNSLIDMYSKCGQLKTACEVFNNMVYPDIVSWNVLITGYAINGLGEDAPTIFSKMRVDHTPLDKVSFLAILSACRHGGLVEEGKSIFEYMKTEYSLEPKLEHYACMVDLFGRSGHLKEAWNLIKNMPMQPDASVWGAFLDACRLHGDLRMGKMAHSHLVGLESASAGPYVLLSNICAEHGNWVEARRFRKSARNMGLSKTPGYSWL